MEEIAAQGAPVSDVPVLCPVCHLAVKPEYYFCPNCGHELHKAPLSTTPLSQAWLYGLSIVLPSILFIAIRQWRGVEYLQSSDPKTKQIGQIAVVLLVLSTLLTFYLAYEWTVAAVQSSIESINADMSI